jgi:PAS domain S-box-containing protein
MLTYRIAFLFLSIILQITAAIFAFRLISLTRRRTAWIFISSAILLMAFRRLVTLLGIIFPSYGELLRWIAAESIALAISGFMLTGVVLIAHIFREKLCLENDLRNAKNNLERLNSIMTVIRNINQLIIRERNIDRLLNDACSILVLNREYRFAWVGLVQEDSFEVVPAGQAGFEEGYLDGIRITWDDTEYGECPASIAIKTGKPFIMLDIAHDPRFETCREEALRRGYASSIALPLSAGERIFGAINIYSETIDAFDDEELCLLEELAGDVAFAIQSIEHEKEYEIAERKVLESTGYTRSLIEASLDPMFTISSDGKVADVNQAMEKATGLPRKELIGTDFSDHFTEPFRASLFYRKVLAAGSARDYSLEIKHSDGRIMPVMCNASVYKDSQGHVAGVFAAARDLTEIRNMEHQLRQSQKMEAIGILAGGIAHDFNNILSPIMGYTEMALSDLSAESEIHKDLNQVLVAAERARDLVAHILTFSRQAEGERKPVELASVVREVLKLLQAALPTTIKIKQNITSDTYVINANTTQIHQILMNLCTNAEHAMRKGGVLGVSLANVDLDKEFFAELDSLTPGSYVRLSVSDTGCGMDSKTLERIFDPFFTTKDPDEGTGMGLSVVHGIVKDHEGCINVQSDPDAGTTFNIYLPVIEFTVEVLPEKQEPILGGTESILFVDDEEVLVSMAGETLKRLGYRITTRTSSVEALKLFRTKPNEFDLVITDLTMPEMTGDDLALKILSIKPDIPIILCTGFSHDVTPEKARALGVRELVMKPVVGTQLGQTVRRVLDESQ